MSPLALALFFVQGCLPDETRLMPLPNPPPYHSVCQDQGLLWYPSWGVADVPRPASFWVLPKKPVKKVRKTRRRKLRRRR